MIAKPTDDRTQAGVWAAAALSAHVGGEYDKARSAAAVSQTYTSLAALDAQDRVAEALEELARVVKAEVESREWDDEECQRCDVPLDADRNCVEPGRADGGCADCGACPDCVRTAAQHREAAAAEDGEQVTVRRIEVLRYRVVLPHGTLKGIAEADARALAKLYGGAVDRQVVRLEPDRGEYLGPWRPVALAAVADA